MAHCSFVLTRAAPADPAELRDLLGPIGLRRRRPALAARLLAPGLLASGLLLSGLLAPDPAWGQGGPSKQAWAGPAGQVTAAPGQSAADIALDHVPAGISFEQFLLALYRQNPQALSPGALQTLPAGTALTLPSAAQAGAVPQDQARAQLLSMRQAAKAPAAATAAPVAALVTAPVAAPIAVPVAADPQPTAGQAPSAQEAASQPSAADARPVSAHPAAAAQMPPASPAGARATGLPLDPLLIILGGGALLVMLLLAFRRSDQRPAAALKPAGPVASPGQRAAGATPRTEPGQAEPAQQPERLRPALPLSPDRRPPSPAVTAGPSPASPLASPLASPVASSLSTPLAPAPRPTAAARPAPGAIPVSVTPESPAPASPTPASPTTAGFTAPARAPTNDRGQLGTLPSLELGGPDSTAEASAGPGQQPLTAPAAPAPLATAPGPLDLSGISLDLHDAPPPRS